MDLMEHVDTFARRVVLDALVSADSWHWVRRAEAFEAAMPRPDDYLGQGSPEALEARRERLGAKTETCRRHAFLLDREAAA